MPKPAIIQLDTTVVNLRTFCRHLTHIAPLPSEQQLLEGARAVFDDCLNEVLPTRQWKWVDRRLAEQIAAEFGWKDNPEWDQLVKDLDMEISEHLFTTMMHEITGAIGSDVHYAWHPYAMGTAVVLKPGGILINVDRLKLMGGVVELDLAEHWAGPISGEEQDDLNKQLDHITKTRATQRFESGVEKVKVRQVEPGLKARRERLTRGERARLNGKVPAMPVPFDKAMDEFEGTAAPEVIDEPTETTVVVYGERDYKVFNHAKAG